MSHATQTNKALPEGRAAQTIIAAGLVAVAAAAMAAGGLTTPLHGLDTQYILDNEALGQWDRAVGADRVPGTGALTLFILCFGVNLTPGSTLGLHAIGLIVHMLASVGVFLLARYILRRPDRETLPMTAGLLFAVHPLALSAYMSPAHLGVQLATVLVLGATCAFLAATEDGVRLRFGLYAWALICAALAWASHSAVWILPVLILTADAAARGGGMYWPRLRLHAPFFIIAAAGYMTFPAGDRTNGSIMAALGMARRAFGQVVWPWGTLVHYPVATAPMWVATALVLGGGIAYFAIRRRPIGAITLWIGLGLLAAYLPLANAGMDYFAGTAYLGLTGVALILPWAVRALDFAPVLPQAMGAVAALLVIAGAWTSFQSVLTRQLPERLWETVLTRYPDDAYASYQIGRLRVARGEAMLQDASALAQADRAEAAQAMLDDGADLFKSAVAPLESAAGRGDEAAYWFYLGVALFYENRDEDAVAAFQRALERDLGYQDAALRLALLHHARFDATRDRAALLKAVDHYRIAERTGAFPPDTADRFIAALAEIGAFEEADAFLRKLRDRPGVDGERFAQAAESVATLTARALELDTAAFEQARTRPESIEAFLAAGQALSFRGRHRDAAYAFEAAHRVAPDDARAWTGLGRAYAGMGQESAFAVYFGSPPGADARAAWEALARACIESRQYDAAAVYLGAAGVERPEIMTADMAWDIAPPERIKALLQQAAEADPVDPVPWLRLFDLALTKGRASEAVDSLAEAERLGASESDIAPRREQLESRLAAPDAGSLRVTPEAEPSR